MRKLGIIGAIGALANVALAAPPSEPVQTRLEGVNPASREVVAEGLTWPLSSTAAISMPGLSRASLRDLKPGMNVRLDLVASEAEKPVIRAITVLPD